MLYNGNFEKPQLKSCLRKLIFLNQSSFLASLSIFKFLTEQHDLITPCFMQSCRIFPQGSIKDASLSLAWCETLCTCHADKTQSTSSFTCNRESVPHNNAILFIFHHYLCSFFPFSHSSISARVIMSVLCPD